MTELKDIEQEKWTIFWKHRKKNAWGQFFDWLNEKVVFKDFSQIMAENSSQGLVLEAGSGCAESTLFLCKERGDQFEFIAVAVIQFWTNQHCKQSAPGPFVQA